MLPQKEVSGLVLMLTEKNMLWIVKIPQQMTT